MAKVKASKPPKNEKPEAPVVIAEQPYAAIKDIIEYVEKASVGVTHRELSMALKGMLDSLEIVEGWVKNIQDVEADIAKKIKK
jgi:hypothetical protein